MAISSRTPAETVSLLRAPEPVALIDLREQEEFARGHILRSSIAPLSRLEFLLQRLVPCKKIPVVLTDGGEPDDGRAQLGCERMKEMGYADVSVLEGGIKGWKKAGLVLIHGTSCMAQGYAEYMERALKTPGLTPAEIGERIAKGEKVLLADIRVDEEYRRMAIPGGVSAPGCELAYRFLDLAPDPETLIITNCGSRTRGIFCAQMLIDFGVPNPVASMRGGTLNWKLSGQALEFQRTDRTAPPSFAALQFARRHAEKLAEDYGVSFIDADTLRQWRAEAEDAPLYVFDVRQPEEYEAGHLPGSRCAPGCQLLQLSDDLAAVRNGRFVLVDDTEVRAIITAYWLKLVAVPHVHVLKGGIGGSGMAENHRMEQGPEPGPVIECRFDRAVHAAELVKALAGGNAPLVINVGRSDHHREGHVPGAVWGARCWLKRLHVQFPDALDIVLTADDETHARLAAQDAQSLWPQAAVRFLRGGNEAWKRLELPLEKGMPSAFCAEDDIWYLVYKDPHASEEAMRRFFDWEDEKADRIVEDGTYAFQLPLKQRG